MDTMFIDAAGRRWIVASPFDLHAIHRVRQLASIDLLMVARGDKPFPTHDQPRTVLALWAIVKPEATSVGITVTEFTQAMQDPDLQAAAVEAVLEALSVSTAAKES